MSQQAMQNAYNQATELYGQAKAILDGFTDPKSQMPAEKQQEVDRLFEQYDAKIVEAKRWERAFKAASEMQAINQPQNELDAPKATPERVESDPKAAQDAEAKAALVAWSRLLKNGPRNLTGADLKALRADSDPAGGFIVAPQQVVQQLIKAVDDLVFIRALATVYPLEKAESLGVPVLDTDLSDATWTSELLTGSEDTVEPFNKRELKPSPLAKRIKVSRKLLRQSTINVDNLIRDRLAYKFALAQENAFMTGTGVNQPLGVFTASNFGISTGRDTAAASATVLAGDDFINTRYALKAAYWRKARWILHRDVLKAARKLKDSTNNYLWSPGLGPGGGLTGAHPDTLVDQPFSVSEIAPSTIAASQYVAILGDFSHYWIAEALNLEIQVITELYAETNQIGYIGRLEVDAMPVHEEAFRRLIMAAS